MIYIESSNGGSYTLNTGNQLNLDDAKGAKKLSGNGRYEISLAVLKKLQKQFNIYPNANAALQALRAK